MSFRKNKASSMDDYSLPEKEAEREYDASRPEGDITS
jgi:hypothetical protein